MKLYVQEMELLMSEKISNEDCVSCLQKDFRKMLLDRKFTDVKFRVENEILTAHRVLLASRSPVFAAMFEQDMSENKTGIIDIVDVDANTFSSFLEYIYTGSIGEMNEEMALKLLVVADKYQVFSLVKKCSTYLMSVLSKTNICEVLLVADMVNQEELKLFVKEFILKNSTSILSSPEWLQIVKMNNTFATELLLLISNKLDKESKICEFIDEVKEQLADITLSFGVQGDSSYKESQSCESIIPVSSGSQYGFNFNGSFEERKPATQQSGFSFGTISQTTMTQNFQHQFNFSALPSSNIGAASSTGPFQFVASSDSSETASAGQHRPKKPLRRMKHKDTNNA